VKDFLNYIREQGIVGLAVGIILGSAVKDLVTAIIEDLVNPLLGLLLNKAEGLTSFVLNISDAELSVGHLLSVIIDFVVISTISFILVRKLKFDKIDKKKKKA
jgi:large conductance mechanosensitive channel